jgi:hypothetical protein
VDGVVVLAECRGVGEKGIAEVADGEVGYTSSTGVSVDRWVAFSVQEVSVRGFPVVGEDLEGFRGVCSDVIVGW